MNHFNIPPAQRKLNVSPIELKSKPTKYRTDTTYSKSDTDLNFLTKKLILKLVPAYNEAVTVDNFEYLNNLSNITLSKQTKKEVITSLINLDSNAFISILLTYGGTSRVITTANEFLNKHSSYTLNESLTDIASTKSSHSKLYFSDNNDSALKAVTKRYEALIDKALLVVKDDISKAVATFREVKLAEIKAMEQAEANRTKLKEMLG
ncbi:hypothetical protein ACPV5G_00805 [Photobacterium damselae]|uniref:hypothetical protein n=1 Tax=Photobacterium damselae TaxID=38293 RepID=UPI004068FF38